MGSDRLAASLLCGLALVGMGCGEAAQPGPLPEPAQRPTAENSRQVAPLAVAKYDTGEVYFLPGASGAVPMVEVFDPAAGVSMLYLAMEYGMSPLELYLSITKEREQSAPQVLVEDHYVKSNEQPKPRDLTLVPKTIGLIIDNGCSQAGLRTWANRFRYLNTPTAQFSINAPNLSNAWTGWFSINLFAEAYFYGACSNIVSPLVHFWRKPFISPTWAYVPLNVTQGRMMLYVNTTDATDNWDAWNEVDVAHDNSVFVHGRITTIP